MSYSYDHDVEYGHDGDYEDEQHDWDYGFHEDDPDFADPGGNSALRAETPDNPRNLPCPCCGDENVLTPKDRALGYICNPCADQAERNGEYRNR